jgi:5-methylcytosine-specific restriction endonuclease McrA
LAVLGEPCPPQTGWIDRAIGREISDDDAEKFVSFANKKENKKKGVGAKLQLQKDRQAAKVKALQVKLLTPQPFVNTDPVTGVSCKAFLQSYEWRRLRMVALKRYGARCQCCGAAPQDGAVMNVDHIKPRLLFPHLALDINNLQVLCHECNHGKGNWDTTDWRSVESKA